MRNNKLYRIWNNMKQRCLNPNNTYYKDYGARGITIYKDWLLFKNFHRDVVNSYNKHIDIFGHVDTTIDREDNEKGYYPDNIRWATRAENNLNRRCQRLFKTTNFLSGETIISNNQNETAKRLGLDQSNIVKCLKGKRKSVSGWKFEFII